MEGIFKRRIKEYIWAGILTFIGAICAASFSVIMILAIAEHEATRGDFAVFATFIALGLICIIFGIGNIVNVYRDENMCRICIAKVPTGEFYYTIEGMSTASDNRFSLATVHRSELFPDRESLVRSFGESAALLSDVTENFKSTT